MNQRAGNLYLHVLFFGVCKDYLISGEDLILHVMKYNVQMDFETCQVYFLHKSFFLSSKNVNYVMISISNYCMLKYCIVIYICIWHFYPKWLIVHCIQATQLMHFLWIEPMASVFLAPCLSFKKFLSCIWTELLLSV